MKFPPGTYYVGDPCYAIPDQDWTDFCDLLFSFKGSGHNPSDGKELVEDGFGFEFSGEQVWCADTKYGDGGYHDQDRREYSVDAGMIGVVPTTLIVPEPGSEATHDPRKGTDTHVEGGHMIEFTEEFTVERINGSLIRIGNIKIETDDGDEEEDNDWW